MIIKIKPDFTKIKNSANQKKVARKWKLFACYITK